MLFDFLFDLKKEKEKIKNSLKFDTYRKLQDNSTKDRLQQTATDLQDNFYYLKGKDNRKTLTFLLEKSPKFTFSEKEDLLVNPKFLKETINSLVGNNNFDTQGNFECLLCKDSSTTVNSTNVSNSYKVVKSSNVSDSAYVFWSREIHKSVNVSRSQLISKSANVEDSANVTDSMSIIGVYNSTKIKYSENCVLCSNCTYCVNCTNVTHGYNLTNVSNSFRVEHVFNGTNLTHVKRSEMVSNIFNGTLMKNASNCEYCNENSNCTGGECNITKFAKDLDQIVQKQLRANSILIIDQLYTFMSIGEAREYNKTNSEIDDQLIHAMSSNNDLNLKRMTFENEGVFLNQKRTLLYGKDPNPLKYSALDFILKKEVVDKDLIFELPNDGKLNSQLVDLLTKEAGIDFFFDFNYDIHRTGISLKNLRKKSNSEMGDRDQYYQRLASDDVYGFNETKNYTSSNSNNETNTTNGTNGTNGTNVTSSPSTSTTPGTSQIKPGNSNSNIPKNRRKLLRASPSKKRYEVGQNGKKQTKYIDMKKIRKIKRKAI